MAQAQKFTDKLIFESFTLILFSLIHRLLRVLATGNQMKHILTSNNITDLFEIWWNINTHLDKIQTKI